MPKPSVYTATAQAAKAAKAAKVAQALFSEPEIESANREDLIAYLEGWGFACYDHETTDELRTAAIENFRTEAAEELRAKA